MQAFLYPHCCQLYVTFKYLLKLFFLIKILKTTNYEEGSAVSVYCLNVRVCVKIESFFG